MPLSNLSRSAPYTPGLNRSIYERYEEIGQLINNGATFERTAKSSLHPPNAAFPKNSSGNPWGRSNLDRSPSKKSTLGQSAYGQQACGQAYQSQYPGQGCNNPQQWNNCQKQQQCSSTQAGGNNCQQPCGNNQQQPCQSNQQQCPSTQQAWNNCEQPCSNNQQQWGTNAQEPCQTDPQRCSPTQTLWTSQQLSQGSHQCANTKRINPVMSRSPADMARGKGDSCPPPNQPRTEHYYRPLAPPNLVDDYSNLKPEDRLAAKRRDHFNQRGS